MIVYGNHIDGVAFVIWDNYYGINICSKRVDSIKLLINQENNEYIIQNDIVICIIFYCKNGNLCFKHFLLYHRFLIQVDEQHISLM
jgi:hypothetical protein